MPFVNGALRKLQRRHNTELLTAVLPFEGALRALLWRLTRNQDDVDELLQETYVRLLTDESGHARHHPGSFALRVARCLAIDRYRRSKIAAIDVSVDVDALEVLDESQLLEEVVNDEMELRIVLGAIQQLAPAERQVILMRKIYGYGPSEIAKRLGKSINTVEGQLTKGSRHLANILGAQL